MGDSPSFPQAELGVETILSAHPCFQHYIRIPDRICNSLDFFDVRYDRIIVHQTLKSFYIFIGIVDHAMDTISISIASEVLHQLKQPCSLPEGTLEVPYKLATELLKLRIHPEVYNTVLDHFSYLCAAVFRERCSKSTFEYISERKLIGSLTAEISYLLIEPYLAPSRPEILEFFCKVGEVGCLIDSLIDLGSDYKKKLIDFAPDLISYTNVSLHAASIGLPILWRYPKLIHIFYEAVVDNCRDFRR